MNTQTMTPDLVEAAVALVEWLNGYGRTNKPRRSRVPARLLDALEAAVAKAQHPVMGGDER